MHKPILLLLCTLMLVSSCKRKNTPVPADPVPTEDSTTGGGDDSTANWENIMAKQVDGGFMGKSIKCHDGNILALGKNADGLPVIRKIAMSTGSITWVKEISSLINHKFTGITETDDNDIVVSGYTAGTSSGLIVVAYNSSGDEKWRKTYSEPDHRLGTSRMISLSNSNLLIYISGSYSHEYNSYRLVRMLLDKEGTRISSSISGSPSGLTVACSDMIRTSDNRIVALFNSPPASFNLTLLDESGTYIKTGTVSSGVPWVNCSAVKETATGEFLCCGYERPISGPGAKGFVARFSSELDNLDYDIYDNPGLTNIIHTNNGFTVVGANGAAAYI
ncbi:MAG TPA: hypothetical protein VEB40_13570, partial [Flavipsychrobacter sp.]|nr:hypothetical protein [Flavipsychrobacter sp.]